MIQPMFARQLKGSIAPLIPVIALCAMIGLQAGCASAPESRIDPSPSALRTPPANATGVKPGWEREGNANQFIEGIWD
jgi:hypothetical protein